MEKDIISFIQEKGTGQEIPDPPRYINFCRGELNDAASEVSEDESYSVAQFQRTINPAFRSSSPQPSVFESHHDPQSELAVRMGHQETPQSRETTLTPQKAMQPPNDYRRQAKTQAIHGQMEGLATVPHNEYPTDGMTMFCRTAPPSERSSVASPVRPSSRDSQSEYSNPTSFSSQEPPSGKQSPIKNGVPISPSKEVQKKRSGFFSNSPFRRKSKHEKDGRDGRDLGTIPVLAPKTNTWGPSSRNAENNSSPPRSYVQGNHSANSRDRYSGSPEPVDPRANFQLNVGPNVFDVASPDSNRNKPTPNPLSSTKELDPIAQALAELKGINKQSSVRMSADRYHGIATPGPPGTPGTPSTPTASTRHNDVSAAQRGTPPPSYNDQTPVKRLDLPKPAFTSAQMKQTTRKYVGQNHDIYGSRPGTRNSNSEVPRATSPLPLRSVSPRPGYNATQGSAQGYGRSVSPNPQSSVGRPRAQSSSPTKPSYSSNSAGSYSRHEKTERTVSPLPQFTRQERPSSSGAMALQLSNGGNLVSQRDRGTARPMTYYGGQHDRARSKSVADGRKYTQDGRPILHFGRSLLRCDDRMLTIRSKGIVPVSSCNSRRAELRKGRCSGSVEVTR